MAAHLKARADALSGAQDDIDWDEAYGHAYGPEEEV